MSEVKRIVAYDRNDFRKWFRKNHKKERRVAVVLYKRHTGKKAPTHRELMEEAICYGWIDTTIKRLDEDRYVRNFCKRTEKSKWSENTLRYAKDLIKRGKMAKEGMKYYELGLARPTYDHGIDRNPDMPLELKMALGKDRKAKENFERYPPSSKKMFFLWLLSGKREETRKKRIERILELAREGKKRIF